MDRGLCNADNINALYKDHYKILLGASSTPKYARDFIYEIGDANDHFEFYDNDFDLYVFSETIAWDYAQQRSYMSDTIHAEHHMYLHLYFNSEKHVNDAKGFNCRMLQCREEMLSGHRMPEHEKGYRNYFEIKENPKCGTSVTYRKDKIDEAHERYGFFILLSNEVKDSITALKLYKMRNITDKAFWNYKNLLSVRRALTSSESALEGKLFVEFVEFIHPCLNKKMEDGHLYSRYTIHELLDELDVIERHLEPGMVPIQGEVLMKQEQFIAIWRLGRGLLTRNKGSY